MTKLQKNKKGFTLTELAIVIAVIAILVAVLVPTFTSLIKKAEESSDKQLVKNLNTILTTDESISGNVESMSDAVAVAESNGYNVANLSPTSSGYDILWDQVNNRFLLVNEDNQVVYADSATGLSEGETVTAAYTYWRIIESESDYETYSEKGYSLYITTDLDVETVVSNGGVEYAEGVTSKATMVTADTTTTTASTSSTEGKALASTAIKTASNTSLPLVIVKTNGGSLTIEVTGDATVKHNGTADELNLNSGYYLRNATITNSSINWNSDEVNYEVTEEIETSEGTSSLGIVFGEKVTADQVVSILTNNITVSSTTVVTIGSVEDNVITEAIASLSVSVSITIVPVTTTISTDFAGGLGTENNPYQIATATQLANIGTLSSEMVSGKTYYFKLTSDITWNHTQGTYITEYLNGVFDGNGYSITVSADVGTSASGYGDFWFFNKPINTTIKNLTIYETSFNIAMTYGWYSSKSTLTFENINIGDETCVSTSLMAYKNTSAFIQYFCGQSLTFNNCTNYYSYQSDDSGAYMAVFVGGFVRGTTTTFNKCINYGTLKLPYAGVFIGNGSYANESVTVSGNVYYNTFIVTDCENYGDIYYFTGGSLVAAINSASENVTNTFNEGCINNVTPKSLTDSNLKLTYNTETNALNLTSSTDYGQYLLTYSRYASYKSKDSTSSGTSQITISFDVSVGSIADWGYGVKFYDLTSYKSLENAQDIGSLKKLTDEYYSCSLEGAIVYYDSSNNAFVVDYSSVESENGLVYTLSGAATVKVATYNNNILQAVSTATTAS